MIFKIEILRILDFILSGTNFKWSVLQMSVDSGMEEMGGDDISHKG